MFKLIFLLIVFFIANSVSAKTLDPTRPFGHKMAASVTPSDKKMTLESVIHGNGVSTVIISGQLLKLLDYIGEYQLTVINEKSVILRSTTERIKLTIFKQNVIKVNTNK